MAVRAAKTVADARILVARLINAESPDRIVFTSNATDALNLAIRGLLRRGDKVVTSSMEHNSIRRPLHVMRREHVEIFTARADASGVIEPSSVAQFAEGVRLIAVTHASNVNGAIQPIADFATIARRHGALLLVDGAQTVGAMQVDVQNLGIDLLALPGHKALFGPPGIGALYIGPRVDLAELLPLRTGGTGINSMDDVPPSGLPHRYEAGTLNTLGIAGLLSGVRFVQEMGLTAIDTQHQERTQQLIGGLCSIPGVRVFTPPENARAAVVSFVIDDWEPGEVGAILDQSFDIACRTGLHCAPDACRTIGAGPNGTIRFSPGWFTSRDDIDAAVTAVREIAATPPS
jgi:cysteine desulfurase family protein